MHFISNLERNWTCKTMSPIIFADWIMSHFIYLECISADFRRVLIDQSTIRLLRNEINSQNIYTNNFLAVIDYELNFLFYYTPYKSKIYLKDIAQKAFYCVELIFNWYALFL